MKLSDLIEVYDEDEIKKINFYIRNNIGYETTDFTEMEDDEIGKIWFDVENKTFNIYLESYGEMI